MAPKNIQPERRQQILEALHRCLLEKPFDKTSIKDIAAEAGMNHGMLHYYFNSKEDILLHYIEYLVQLYRSMFNEWLETKRDEVSSPKEFLSASLDFIYRRISLSRDISSIFIEIWEISNYNEKVRVKLRKAYHQWIETVSGLVGDYLDDKASAVSVSTALVAFLEGLSLFSVMFDSEEFSLKSLLDTLRTQFVDKLCV